MEHARFITYAETLGSYHTFPIKMDYKEHKVSLYYNYYM